MFRNRHITSTLAAALAASCRHRRAWLLVMVVIVVTALALLKVEGGFATTRTVKTVAAALPQGDNLNYSAFKHTSSRHVGLGCTACHQRGGDNSIKSVGVGDKKGSGFPYHSACQSCHLNQFLTPGSPMCLICHQNVNGKDAPLKNFPTTFKESFNVKFDHAQHMAGSVRPKTGCVFCHSRPLNRGTALSIPTGLSAHSQCYTCHTPGSKGGGGRDIATCGVCHSTQKYNRVSTNSRSFRQAFSHAQHGPRQRLDCTTCHTPTPGVPIGRQVSSPRSTQHFVTGGGRSCGACHDGTPTFGGDLDFKSCHRCHTGTSFRFPT